MAKCPHCSAPIPFFTLFGRGMMLGGARYPIGCAKCERGSYLSRNSPNAVWALAILALGAAASLPSPVSDSLLSGLSRQWSAIARFEIWAFATLAAFALFSFGGKLLPVAEDAQVPAMSLRSMILKYALLATIIVWGYLMYRGLWTS